MFTHLHPELVRDNTATSIRRESLISIWRAINLKRLVAFTGSGTSTVYGLPAWSELPQTYADCVNAQIDAAIRTEEKRYVKQPQTLSVRVEDLRRRLRPTLDQINALTCDQKKPDSLCVADRHQIRFSKPFGGDVLTFFALCDEILDRLPDDEDKGLTRRFMCRAAFGQTVRVGEAKIIRNTLSRLLRTELLEPDDIEDIETCSKEHPEGRFLNCVGMVIEKLKCNDPKKLNEDKEFLKDLYQASLPPDHLDDAFGSELEHNDPASQRDMIKTLMSDLGISRFVTLNYDVQIERAILRDQRMTEDSETEPFRDLCNEEKTPRPHQKRLVIESGVGKGAISATLDHGNIAEVVNFAAYSKRYARQVMHLHGRFDDPENMILAGADYVNLYEEKSVARDSFSNAQRTLFDGNDVLFVGIGMSEDEINRPLKRFLATEKYGRPHSRRAFLLFPASACTDCKPDTPCDNCKIKDENFVLTKHNQLGVSAILYGGPKFRYLSAQLKNFADKFSKFSGDGDKPSDQDREKLIEMFWTTVRDDDIKRAACFEGAGGGDICLLTDAELEYLRNLTDFLHQTKTDQFRHPHLLASLVGGICSELRGRVMSRAACAEFRLLRENSEKWWDAWNEQPFERRAIYHMADKSVSGADGYLWVRHCPVAGFEEEVVPHHWLVLQKARDQIKRQVERQRKKLPEIRENKTRLSIGRFAVERGLGQGSMVRLLHRKSVQEYVFGRDGAREQGYKAAFIAHLSFSMEFASVSKALTRFLARRVAELQIAKSEIQDTLCVEGGIIHKELWNNLKSTKPLNTKQRVEIRRLAKDLAPKERQEYRTIHTKLKSVAEQGPGLKDEALRDLARALYLSRRETEPRLLFDEDAQTHDQLKPDPERAHRLDMLQMILQKYQDLAVDQKVFICLGGLDRLCDRDGDAHNPMHRALFRLLTGTHDYAELDPPIDLLLLAGQPNAPICFLSETLERNAVEKLQSHEYKNYSRHSKTKLVLRKWDRLERLSWATRVALASSFFGKTGFQNILGFGTEGGETFDPNDLPKSDDDRKKWAAAQFIGWAIKGDASSLTVTSDAGKAVTGLHRVLWQNVGLSNMLYTCWETSVLIHRKNPRFASGKVPTILDFMAPLERQFNRDEENGVLSGIFNWYRKNRPDDEDEKDSEVLHDLVLRHLVLYALPVEPWVLLGCPRIHRVLLRDFDGTPRADNIDINKTEDNAVIERAWMLDRLRQVLDRLCSRGMLIRIHCSVSPVAYSDSNEEFLHHRFALHGRVREFIAYRMQLNIFDQGDTNHHQISLYCDQPKDLPTPSALHFGMIAEILNHQRDSNRETLELTYRHSRAGRQNRLRDWDPVKDQNPHSHRTTGHSKRAARRLFRPSNPRKIAGIPKNIANKALVLNELGGSLGQMHAVTQRIRGSFSLVRSAFSVGSLSRMDSAPVGGGEIPPFELYRGWLRSILNAATGVRVNNVELSGTLDGTLLPRYLGANARQKCITALKAFEAAISNGDRQTERNKAEKALSILGIGPLPVLQNSTTDDDRDYIAAGHDALAIQEQAGKLGLRSRQSSRFTQVRHPLYRDEIAWLFNERALTSLIQGRIFDAIPLFRKARDIMSHKTTPTTDSKAFNAVERRINLNFAVAKIERGRIRDARLVLRDLARSSVSVPYSTPSRLEPYIIGYTALCDHLSGSFETARAAYLEALDQLSKSKDLRAIGIFKRHLADLYREIGDLDLAHREIQLAINAASQAQQRDTLHLAYSSRAQIDLALENRMEVEDILPQLKDYAERMGLYSHRADALMVQSRLAIAKGDLGPAADAVSGAIALCTRHGLRLRKLSGLVAYGAIQYRRDQDDIAHSILTHAKAEAEQIGYQIKASQASRLMAQRGKARPLRVTLENPQTI